MIPEELDKILATTENVKNGFTVIPDFQNPTGKNMDSGERRQKFMELDQRNTKFPLSKHKPLRRAAFLKANSCLPEIHGYKGSGNLPGHNVQDFRTWSALSGWVCLHKRRGSGQIQTSSNRVLTCSPPQSTS